MANPTDLNTLDENAPNGAIIPVSLLDDFDRETRRYLKGWPSVEHSLTGVHAFGVGPTADRPPSGAHPVAPVQGTIFFNTDTMQVEVFVGGVWQTFGQPPIPTGTIAAWAGALPVPPGWRHCNGVAISRVTFANLFAVIGTTYGIGDGVSTFNVPDLRGRVPVGSDASGDFPGPGFTGGERTHVLTVPEIPSHNHALTDPGHRHNLDDGGRVSSVAANITANNQNGPDGNQTDISPATTGITLAATGGDGAHNNLQPYLVIAWMIKI